jgi:hypothetical protein
VEVSEILAIAQAEVDKAKIAGPLKPIAFEKAVDLVAASAGLAVGKAAAPSPAPAARSSGGAPASDGTLLGSVSARLNIRPRHRARGGSMSTVAQPPLEARSLPSPLAP